MPLTAILVEDSRTIRDNLIPALEELAGVHVVATAETAQAAIDALALQASWQLAIVDLFLKEGSGLTVVRACQGRARDRHLVVLTNYPTPRCAAAAWRSAPMRCSTSPPSSTPFSSTAWATRPPEPACGQPSMKNSPARGLGRARWVPGNRVSLLENGEEFFPRVFEAVRRAQREVLIETFILYEDKVGTQLHACLCEAARRGVRVDLLVDGFGSPDLSEAFIQEMAAAGVRLRVFDPGHSILGQRLNLLRRMHRKIVVVDDACAFVGGINFSADQLLDFGATAKQDYAVELNGPIVQLIHRFAARAVAADKKKAKQGARSHRPAPPERQQEGSGHATGHARAGEAEVCLVTRDNWRHTNDIERHYRVAIRSARQRVVIANAYFFPATASSRTCATRRGGASTCASSCRASRTS